MSLHYIKTLHAIDMSDGTEQSGSPVVIADTGYVGTTAVSFAGPSVRGKGAGASTDECVSTCFARCNAPA